LQLGGIDAFALFVEKPGDHQVDFLAQELVLQGQPFNVRAEAGIFGEEFLFTLGRHLLQT
jgi:hypothetical protein